MRLPTAVTALTLLALPANAQAPQGMVELAPRLAPGEPLSIELRNLSKLSTRLETARLTIPDAAGTVPCVLSLPSPVSLGRRR